MGQFPLRLFGIQISAHTSSLASLLFVCLESGDLPPDSSLLSSHVLSRVLSLKPPGVPLPLENCLCSLFIQGFGLLMLLGSWKDYSFPFCVRCCLVFLPDVLFLDAFAVSFPIPLCMSPVIFCWNLEEGRTLAFSGYTRCVRTGRVLDGLLCFPGAKKRPVFKCLCVCTHNAAWVHI